MCVFEEEATYEEKMDNISIHLEELILDAMLSVLHKINERTLDFEKSAQKNNTAVEPF